MVKKNKAWVAAVNMGYGHQRTADNLKSLAKDGKIIIANDYKGIPEKDRKIWESSRKFYEFLSRIKKIPIIGEPVFSIFDEFQKIVSFYPKKEIAKPTFALKRTLSLIDAGWGRDLISKLNKNPLPLVCTFFIPAFMAEKFGYEGEIFCVVCDADISRSWVTLDSSESRIKYFAPTFRVVERLELYGVKKENIFLTGYPLPKGNIGEKSLKILKNDVKSRLLNLDPKETYRGKYKPLIKKYLGKLPKTSNHPLTLMFCVGGAGAQKEIGIKIIKSLSGKIKTGEVKIILSAGIKKHVKEYFLREIEELGLKNILDKNIEIIFSERISDYFKKFNQELRKTDILWTKPSELSFYAALGLPLIIAPPIGSQEDFNRRWLLKSGFGLTQESLNHTDQWLFDFLNRGFLAEAAMQGFVEGEKLGVFNIKKYIFGPRK